MAHPLYLPKGYNTTGTEGLTSDKLYIPAGVNENGNGVIHELYPPNSILDEDSGGGGTVFNINDYNTYLSAYWNMNETSGTRVDSVTGYDLTDVGSCGYASGKYGNCVEIASAGSQYLLYTGDLGISTGFAFSFWFYMDGFTDITPLFWLDGGARSSLWTSGDPFGSSVDFGVTQSDSTVLTASVPTPISVEEWCHITCVAENVHGYVRVYFNGSLGDTKTYDKTLATITRLLIGPSSYDRLYVDETACWNGIQFSSTSACDSFASTLYNDGSGLFWNGSAWIEVLT
jgi:hypothetical protein